MKAKQISKEKYIEIFCQEKRIRERQVLYVSEEVHRRMKRVALLFSEQHITVSSLIDAILYHHLDTHHQLLIQIRDEQAAEFMARPTYNHSQLSTDDVSDEDI